MAARTAAIPFNGSTDFNGSTSKIEAASPAILDGDMSVSCWLKLSSLGGGGLGRIIDNGVGTLFYFGTNNQFWAANSGAAAPLSPSMSVIGTHLFVTLSRVGRLNTLYINGVASSYGAVDCGAVTTGATTLTIGNRSTNDRALHGKMSELLFGPAVTSAEAALLYTHAIKPNGCTNFYPLDDLPSTYTDSIGGNNGTGTATTFSTEVPSKARVATRYMGGSTSFNGSTSYIDATAHASLLGGGERAFWTWVYIKSTANGQTIVSMGATNAVGKLMKLAYDGGNKKLSLTTYGTDFASTITLERNRWYFVTAEIDTHLHVYVDNQEAGTPVLLNNTLNTDGTIVRIGRRSNSTEYLTGNIAEVGAMARRLTDEERTVLYVTGEQPEDAVHFWPLDDQPSTYIDTIGGNNGTGTATTYSTDVPVQARVAVGDDRASLLSDGVDDEIVLTDSATLRPTTAITTQILFKKSNLDAGNMVFGRPAGTTDYTPTIQATNDLRVNLKLSTTNLNFNTSGVYTIPKNDWVNAICVYDSVTGIGAIYVNGKLIKTGTGVGTLTNTGDWKLVGHTGLGFLKGNTKVARMWNVALTAQQIRDLHFSNIVPRTGLVGEWLLNEGAGSIAYDTSGNGNDGTITGACLTGDTLVKTSNGMVRIDEIEIGDEVYSYTDEGMKKQVVSNVIPAGKKDVFTLKTRNRAIRASDNHPFLVAEMNGKEEVVVEYRNSCRHKNAWKLQWKQLKDIKVGDSIVVQSDNTIDNNKYSDDMMEFIGCFLGDGSYHKRNRKGYDEYSIQLHLFDNELIQKYSAILDNLDIPHTSDGKHINIYTRSVGELLNSLGLDKNCYTKRVPEFVWGLSKESKKKLLSGIFDTDGWKVNTCENTYGVQLANKELVEDLRHIAIDCGYKVTNVVANKARVGGIIDGRQIVSKGSYSFCWTEKHNQNKTARGLLEDGSRPRVNIKLPDGFQLQKVVAIELSGHEEVYDISVQEHHNFIADGIVVHNSWSADVPSPARKQVGGNMVPNGDFEKTISLVAGNISGWGTGIGFAGAGTTITMGTDDTNYYKVTWGTAGGYIDNLGTLFNANPNTSYRLKFRMRRQYISGDATAGVSVGVYQYNGAKELWDAGTVGTSRSLNFKDSTDGWVEYEYTFTSQSYTRYIGINIRNYAHQGAGTLKIHFDVDDITLLPTTPVTRTAV